MLTKTTTDMQKALWSILGLAVKKGKSTSNTSKIDLENREPRKLFFDVSIQLRVRVNYQKTLLTNKLANDFM